MERQDILFQIAVRVSNATLLALYPIYRDQINKLLQDNYFWYVRSEYLVGKSLQKRDANWSRIYQALVQELDTNAHLKFSSGLDYLPSLEVMEEAFGLAEWSNDNERSVWYAISSPEVLQYLLASKQIKTSVVAIKSALEDSGSRGRVQMVLPLYNLLKKKVKDEELIIESLTVAFSNASRQKMEEVALLLIDIIVREYELDDNERADVLEAAILGGSRQVIERVVTLYTEDKASLEADSIKLITVAKPDTIEILIDMGALTLQRVKNQLSNAIDSGWPDVIEFLVSRGHAQDLDWKSMLRRAIRYSRSITYVRYLLTKVDPDIPLLELALVAGSISNMLALIRHPSIKVEELSIDLCLRVYSEIRTVIEDSAMGYYEAIRRVATGIEAPVLHDEMSKCTRYAVWYALVLRYIVLKQPSAMELVKWMRAQKMMFEEVCTYQQAFLSRKRIPTDKHSQHSILKREFLIEHSLQGTLKRASLAVVTASTDDITVDIAPFYSLMLCMLYPTLTLERSMEDLKLEGEDKLRVAGLVGAFLGRDKLRASNQ